MEHRLGAAAAVVGEAGAVADEAVEAVEDVVGEDVEVAEADVLDSNADGSPFSTHCTQKHRLAIVASRILICYSILSLVLPD